VDGHSYSAQLLITELVSNAVRHSDEAIRIRAELVADRLKVEVWDSSDRMPTIPWRDVAAVDGRGLRLVRALSRRWGVELADHGKSVWFELDLAPTQLDEQALLAAFQVDDDRRENSA
jgi:two-component sensor histidine kinase